MKQACKIAATIWSLGRTSIGRAIAGNIGPAATRTILVWRFLPAFAGLFLLVLFINGCVTDGIPGRGSGGGEVPSDGQAMKAAKNDQTGDGKRLALVIGNGSYASAPLRNPENDARDMAQALMDVGFKVIVSTNADKREMLEAIDRFGRELKGAETGLFYFAGHGMQVKGRNYLIPINARVSIERDIEIEGVDAWRVLGRMEAGKSKVSIVILDACRNNPFARLFRSGSRGLARMDAPSGSIIGFSTAPGDTAADGAGRNSPYTESLKKYVKQPGLSLEKVFKLVRSEVYQKSGGRQTPWENTSLFSDFYFVPAVVTPFPSASAPITSQTPMPSTAKVDLGDLKQEAEAREKWSRRQKEMKLAFQEAERLEKDALLTPGRKAEAWKRVLSAYEDDNPFSTEDESLRSAMKSRIAHWEALEQAEVKKKMESEKARLEEEGKQMSETAAAAPAAKRIRNSLGQEFVLIPAGTFMMGSPPDEPERKKNEVQHLVTISRPFYIMTTEVTQAHWREVMGKNPSEFKGLFGDHRPVEWVSWKDVQEFIRRLNEKEGGNLYRLPTEAEWEYACRAGATTPFFFGNCLSTDEANYHGHYPMPGCEGGAFRKRTTKAGGFTANAWGLYDMHGNVWEWCQDWYGNYPSGSVTDPQGPKLSRGRVIRGGAWDSGAGICRSAVRFVQVATQGWDNIGFRLARNK